MQLDVLRTREVHCSSESSSVIDEVKMVIKGGSVVLHTIDSPGAFGLKT